MAKNTKTPAMVLQELSVKKNYGPPTYEIIYSVTGTHENRFDYRVTIAGIVAEGSGSSKQISKHKAAHNALMKLKDKGIYNPLENPVQEFNIPLQKNLEKNIPESPFKTSLNCIGPLKDLCLEYKIPDPIFTLISDVGPPHSKEFTFECSVASIKTSATGSTKKMAKQLAAQEMLERINDILPEIAAQYSTNTNQKAISDTDNIALKIYNDFFGSVVPNKTVLIEDFSETLLTIMKEKNLTFENFFKEFSQENEEALKQILDKLDLSFKFFHLQDSPIMVSLSLNTDTPFTTIGVSNDSLEDAKHEALVNAFEIMRIFMQH